MVQNDQNTRNYRNTTRQETIYGWYPQAQTLLIKESPKDIYSKLGSRAPKQVQSMCGKYF